MPLPKRIPKLPRIVRLNGHGHYHGSHSFGNIAGIKAGCTNQALKCLNEGNMLANSLEQSRSPANDKDYQFSPELHHVRPVYPNKASHHHPILHQRPNLEVNPPRRPSSAPLRPYRPADPIFDNRLEINFANLAIKNTDFPFANTTQTSSPVVKATSSPLSQLLPNVHHSSPKLTVPVPEIARFAPGDEWDVRDLKSEVNSAIELDGESDDSQDESSDYFESYTYPLIPTPISDVESMAKESVHFDAVDALSELQTIMMTVPRVANPFPNRTRDRKPSVPFLNFLNDYNNETTHYAIPALASGPVSAVSPISSDGSYRTRVIPNMIIHTVPGGNSRATTRIYPSKLHSPCLADNPLSPWNTTTGALKCIPDSRIA